jgi:hypothetical protein
MQLLHRNITAEELTVQQLEDYKLLASSCPAFHHS